MNIVGSQYHIQRHAESECHKKFKSEAKSTPKMENFISRIVAADSLNAKAKNFEMMVTNFVAEHNLSFSILDHLNLLIKSGITDSNIVKQFCINRKKATTIVTECTGPTNLKQVANICKNQYFSIIIDESIDCTISKNLAILVRLYAYSIFNEILNVFKENDISMKNLVGFGANNCSVMIGKHNGVQALGLFG